MLTGRRETDASAAIPSNRPWSAVAFFLLTAVCGATLAAGYDQAKGTLTLPLLASPLQLSEAEGQAGSEKASEQTDRQNGATEREDDEDPEHDD